MEEWSALWRVRGSLAVPVEADDGGLVSRIGDVFNAAGPDVAEERDDYLLLTAPKYFVRLPVRGAEFRREGIRGWRFIRYDLPILHDFPEIVTHGFVFGGLIGQALVWAGVPPIAYASTLVATALLYWWHYIGTRRSAHDGLRRAFLT
jgi:hypothetical protein